MNVDRIAPPAAGQELEVYRTFLRNLNAESRMWNRKLGRISWLQGCALREARAVCRQGQWQDLLTTLDMKPTTAKYLRKIAELIPEPDSHILTYTEMLTRCYPSYLTAVEQDLTAESAPTAGSKEPGDTPQARPPQSQMVKTLTICLERLQRADASQVATASEDTHDIATLLDQIGAQAARLRAAIAEKRNEPKLPPFMRGRRGWSLAEGPLVGPRRRTRHRDNQRPEGQDRRTAKRTHAAYPGRREPGITEERIDGITGVH